METYPALTSASTPASSQFIRLTDIIIPPDRQRKDFNAQFLSELGETIRKRGLMHAVVLRESDGVFYLVAGESRMRAVSDLWMLGDSFNYNKLPVPENFIPYVTLGQLTPLQAEEAELDENLQRRDLSWMERSAAMAKLHRIRSAQAQAEGRIHTIADTAMETTGKTGGSYQENVRKEIVLAKHLDNPAIAKAATVDEAYKILKKQEETVKNLQLAAVVGKTFTEDLHQLFHVDCLDWMRDTQLLFDVILTDPPYGMGADTFGDAAGSLSNHVHQYDDSKANWIALMSAWCPLAFQVTKPQAHVYVFCDIDNFPQLRELMKLAGFYVFRTPLIHYKPNSGRVPLPTEGPRRQYETDRKSVV